ncbi:hypothetical protein EJ110_NYTH06709 [Nymphaea thermarum]|nr:hypothetical protein EJ110_NYTH06709 [Nymphaea thermarum]
MDQSSNQADNGANSRGDSGRGSPPSDHKAKTSHINSGGDSSRVPVERAKTSANSGEGSGKGSTPSAVSETPSDQKAKTSDNSRGDSSGKAPVERAKTMRWNGDKTNEELMKEIENMQLFKELIAKPVDFVDFYDGLSRIFEKLSVKRGGSHISLPEKEWIKKKFEDCAGKKEYLSKEEFRTFLEEILKSGVGLRNYEMAMYLTAVPVLSVIIKPFIPGTISEIPNSFFIPVVTSATAFILTHMRKI